LFTATMATLAMRERCDVAYSARAPRDEGQAYLAARSH